MNDAQDENGTVAEGGGAPTWGDALDCGGASAPDDAQRLAPCIVQAEAVGWRGSPGM